MTISTTPYPQSTAATLWHSLIFEQVDIQTISQSFHSLKALFLDS
jgi:hypothetical protein